MFELIPWRSRRALSPFSRDVESLFDRFFEDFPFWPSPENGKWIPSMDVSETPKKVLVRAEIPGMDPKEVDISLDGDLLTIRGERKRDSEEKDEKIHRYERWYGAFSRSLRLPAEVDADKVKATYKNGVLTISMPKVKEGAPRRIEVKAA